VVTISSLRFQFLAWLTSAPHCTTLHNTLHHIATYCNTLQHTLLHRIRQGGDTIVPTLPFPFITHLSTVVQHTLQHTLQHTATYCNVLQHTATHCNTLQHTLLHRIRQSGDTIVLTLPFPFITHFSHDRFARLFLPVCCSVLQCALQRFAAGCSVFS